jgi:hypothetical protein
MDDGIQAMAEICFFLCVAWLGLRDGMPTICTTSVIFDWSQKSLGAVAGNQGQKLAGYIYGRFDGICKCPSKDYFHSSWIHFGNKPLITSIEIVSLISFVMTKTTLEILPLL